MKHTDVWTTKYGHVCPPNLGTIVKIAGLGRRDLYNVAVIEQPGGNILAFRSEQRRSFAWNPRSYHPVVRFAREHSGVWEVDTHLLPFDMMEDPFCFTVHERGKKQLIFGGVQIRREGREIIPQTVFYRGTSLFRLDRTPFAIIDNMKDIRLLQLPDGRFLLCRRPWGGEYGRGRITLHILDTLEDLQDARRKLPTLAVLDDCFKVADWVGVNHLQLVSDSQGQQWVGLLGHVAFNKQGAKHYAACTYRILLDNLLAGSTSGKPCPEIIAVRSCFEPGPAKNKGLQDVVFPDHLQHLSGYTYRLWAGLSDTNIGTIELYDPFHLASSPRPDPGN